MNLNELAKQIYEANKEKGFDVAKENKGQTLMLIVSELSEALEALRKNHHARLLDFKSSILVDESAPDSQEQIDAYMKYFTAYIKDSFEDELADALIRILDLCGGLNIDIDKHVYLKRAYNFHRPFKHGKAF